jgi:hypothetical protein
MKNHWKILLALLLASQNLQAAERVALVIGNYTYDSKRHEREKPNLLNPGNDADLVAGALREAQFRVTVKKNLDKQGMEDAVRVFNSSLKEGDVALFYYAGHGAQLGGQNFLLPVGAPLEIKDYEAEDKCFKAQLVLKAMEFRKTKLNVVVLDCCRNNPFTRDWSNNGKEIGMANMHAPNETLIAYATAPGTEALDGEGKNSPYSKALAEEMLRPGVKLEDVFKNVAARVSGVTNGRQRPWTSTDLLGEFFFVLGNSGTSPSGGMVQRPAPSPRMQTPAAGLGAATREKPFVNSIGMRFVPTINYTDGSKGLFCQHETRNADYAAYAAAQSGVDVKWKEKAGSGKEQHPVVYVSYEDAQGFCRWLSAKEGKTYRLPTDAEWSAAVGLGKETGKTPEEKAANGSKEVFPWGSYFPPKPGDGNYALDEVDDGYDRTAPVMSFRANELGIYDLGGNVWEWCQDWYNEDKEYRVLRGASWGINDRVLLRSSYRGLGHPMDRVDSLGFRCVLVVAGG